MAEKSFFKLEMDTGILRAMADVIEAQQANTSAYYDLHLSEKSPKAEQEYVIGERQKSELRLSNALRSLGWHVARQIRERGSHKTNDPDPHLKF